jgi:hypothetical protein
MRKLLLLLFVVLSINAFAQYPCVGPTVTISGDSIGCHGVRDTLFVHGPSATTYIWDNGETTTSIVTGPIDADSTFYVIATNSGCSDTTYYNVTERLAPSITVSSPDTVCKGTNVCLTAHASGIGPITYLWEPEGATKDTLCISPDSTRSYTVTVSNGCTNMAITRIAVIPCLGIDNVSSFTGYNIYPNPSSTEFTLDLPTKAQIKVCDITGHVLFSEMEKPGTITFGKELSPGIYFLFIGGRPGGKIVKL